MRPSQRSILSHLGEGHDPVRSLLRVRVVLQGHEALLVHGHECPSHDVAVASSLHLVNLHAVTVTVIYIYIYI